jgi:hypothetical protein
MRERVTVKIKVDAVNNWVERLRKNDEHPSTVIAREAEANGYRMVSGWLMCGPHQRRFAWEAIFERSA